MCRCESYGLGCLWTKGCRATLPSHAERADTKVADRETPTCANANFTTAWQTHYVYSHSLAWHSHKRSPQRPPREATLGPEFHPSSFYGRGRSRTAHAAFSEAEPSVPVEWSPPPWIRLALASQGAAPGCLRADKSWSLGRPHGAMQNDSSSQGAPVTPGSARRRVAMLDPSVTLLTLGPRHVTPQPLAETCWLPVGAPLLA